jgi:membrane-bound metal-dependent hydrolase YbcI (DUF457 family)
MFVGHFAPAFVAAALPKAPRLSVLFMAAQLVDIAFFPFVILGLEHMRIVPGITAMNPMDLYHMPYTHSLLGSILWGIGFGMLIWALTKNRTGAVIAGGVVVSHWFLDLLVHRPDMTLLGGPSKLGIGFYLSHTRTKKGATFTPAWVLGIALLLVQLFNWLAPEPKAYDISLPVSAVVAYGLFIWLAYRLDRTREVRVRTY